MHDTDDAWFWFHTNILTGTIRYPGDQESEAFDRPELVLTVSQSIAYTLVEMQRD